MPMQAIMHVIPRDIRYNARLGLEPIVEFVSGSAAVLFVEMVGVVANVLFEGLGRGGGNGVFLFHGGKDRCVISTPSTDFPLRNFW